MPKTTAIIMAAGMGTRFLPAAKSINKCALPLGNKPVVQYLVEECVNAGVDDVLIVVPTGDDLIQKHFAPDPVLKQKLHAAGKDSYYETYVAPVEELGKKVRFCDLNVSHVGTALPIQEAFKHIDSSVEQLLIMNGDAIVANGPGIIGELKSALSKRTNEQDGILFGFGVDLQDRHNYGVLINADNSDIDTHYAQSIIEKPDAEISPESLTANIGWYLAPRSIEQFVLNVQPDPNSGEYQLTDAINDHLASSPYVIHTIEGEYLDCGRPDSWIAANNRLNGLF